MTITRTQAETVLLARCGPMMGRAGMDDSTTDSTNADLNDPLGWAIMQLGGSVTDVTSVADADLATVGSDEEDYILDVAEYRLLENILTNLTLTDLTVGPRSEKLEQLGDRIQKRLASLARRLGGYIGAGAAMIETGIVRRDFAEHFET